MSSSNRQRYIDWLEGALSFTLEVYLNQLAYYGDNQDHDTSIGASTSLMELTASIERLSNAIACLEGCAPLNSIPQDQSNTGSSHTTHIAFPESNQNKKGVSGLSGHKPSRTTPRPILKRDIKRNESLDNQASPDKEEYRMQSSANNQNPDRETLDTHSVSRMPRQDEATSIARSLETLIQLMSGSDRGAVNGMDEMNGVNPLLTDNVSGGRNTFFASSLSHNMMPVADGRSHSSNQMPVPQSIVTPPNSSSPRTQSKPKTQPTPIVDTYVYNLGGHKVVQGQAGKEAYGADLPPAIPHVTSRGRSYTEELAHQAHEILHVNGLDEHYEHGRSGQEHQDDYYFMNDLPQSSDADERDFWSAS